MEGSVRDPVKRKASRHAYHNRHKDRRLAEARALKPLYRYGITAEKVVEMRTAQIEQCSFCHQPKKLNIDHDHATGKVRGLLCKTCNIGLGAFKDSLGLLRNASQYLLDEGHYDASRCVH